MSRPSPQTERLMDLIDLMAAEPGRAFSLTDVARATGLGKATVHPMLVALTRRGWLLRSPQTRAYRLGPALVAAGRAAAVGDPALVASRPVLRDLVASTGLIATSLVAGGLPGEDADLLIGEIARPRQGPLCPAPARSGYRWLHLGDRIPPRPPRGAVQVAWADPATVDRWLDRLGPPRRAAMAVELAPALAGIRERGWALEVDNRLHQRLDVLAADLDADASAGPRTRPLRRMIAELSEALGGADVLPARIEPGARYRASVLNAPVFDRTGAVVLIVCVICAWEEEPVAERRGTEIIALGNRVRAAASLITRAIGGTQPVPRH